MTGVLAGFVDELTKTAGIMGSVGKTIMKHPLATLGGTALAGMTGLSAYSAYKGGLAPGEKPRFLAADKSGPSPAFGTNYHELFEHPMSPRDRKKQSEGFKENLARR